MAIRSHAFGRVTLTGPDAEKFKNQVTHGRPTEAASDSARRGVELWRTFSKDGKLPLEPKPTKR